jgi:nucleoside 2-deoxyribosyltransferase
MMKVHFITSRPCLENHIETLRQIVNVVRDNDHGLVHDWVEKAYEQLIEHKLPIGDWSAIYRENLEAIAKSDVIIAETTYENFAVGYEVAMALQQKKPVLLLRREAADKDAFVTGVEDEWARHETYSDATLSPIIEKFFEDNEIKTKDLRFNFFLDRKIYNYLRWAALKTGKTKAEILRDLVQQEIDKKGLLD